MPNKDCDALEERATLWNPENMKKKSLSGYVEQSAPSSTVFRSVMSSAQAYEHSEYRLPDDVILLIAYDGTGRVLNLAGNTSAITQIGAAMLELTLREGKAAACRMLSDRYCIDVELLREDLDPF